MTIGAVIDSALTTVDPATLKMLIDVRERQNTKASVVASIPSVPSPENVAQIYAYLLTATAEPDFPAALSALVSAVQGASASPPTRTWEDVFSALMYFPASVRAAFPS